jgi:hypothetical protein
MVLHPSPPERLCDATGHPYFLWDNDLTLDEFVRLLRDPDEDVRGHAMGKLLRQARTDDALTLTTTAEIRAIWPKVRRHLGDRRAFWEWLLAELAARGQ